MMSRKDKTKFRSVKNHTTYTYSPEQEADAALMEAKQQKQLGQHFHPLLAANQDTVVMKHIPTSLENPKQVLIYR